MVKLVQLVFVNHMSNLTYFYCSVSFARQHIKECVCVGGGGFALLILSHFS